MTSAEFAEVQLAIGRLRECVESLRAAEGDSLWIRRLLNDVDRLELDGEDAVLRVGSNLSASVATPGSALEAAFVPDDPYDRVLWQGADDEGIGGYRRHDD